MKDVCISATIFDWIAKNFENAPLNDIRSDFSKFASCLCLLQAQELAFLSSVNEEKGLKTLVRLSLGLMNLIQSAKSYASNLESSKASLIYQKLENKANFHTFIHCLLMADFWDNHDLYDVAFDLYSTSSRIFEDLKIRNKSTVSDYLKVALMRSEKERCNISYEGKKASESSTQIEPYYLANIMEFKLILRPYLLSYKSLFSNIYPFKIIELQSEFEAKADTIIKTLERAADEVTSVFSEITAKMNSSTEEFIFELRNVLFDNNLESVRYQINEVESFTKTLGMLKNDYIVNRTHKIENTNILDVCAAMNDAIMKIERSKIGLILNDNTLIQTMIPIIRDIHSSVKDSLRTNLTSYEENFKNQLELYENLKSEVSLNNFKKY